MIAAAWLFLASAPAWARPEFCTTGFYTYRDRPISSWSLTCRNASLGLTLHQATNYDAAALFGTDGRCSASHRSTVSFWSAQTAPFVFERDSGQPAQGPRLLEVFRDDDPSQLLLRLTWIQGGDEFRLGHEPATGAVAPRPFRPSEPFVLRAWGLPLSFKTSALVNGRPVEAREVPVDCVLEISPGDWPQR